MGIVEIRILSGDFRWCIWLFARYCDDSATAAEVRVNIGRWIAFSRGARARMFPSRLSMRSRRYLLRVRSSSSKYHCRSPSLGTLALHLAIGWDLGRCHLLIIGRAVFWVYASYGASCRSHSYAIIAKMSRPIAHRFSGFFRGVQIFDPIGKLRTFRRGKLYILVFHLGESRFVFALKEPLSTGREFRHDICNLVSISPWRKIVGSAR